MVRLKPHAGGRIGERTGTVVRVSPRATVPSAADARPDVVTVLLDPTEQWPSTNHQVPLYADEVEVIGTTVRLDKQQVEDLSYAVELAEDDVAQFRKEEGDEDQVQVWEDTLLRFHAFARDVLTPAYRAFLPPDHPMADAR